MRIAVFADAEGNTLAFNQSGIVSVYQDNDSSNWECIRQIPFSISSEMGLSAIHKSIYELAPHLIGCRILVVFKNIGIFKTYFEEELHMRLYVIPGSPVPYLTAIKDHYKADVRAAILRAEEESKAKEEAYPTLVGRPESACFKINLVKVQEKNASMSSKEILMPFFEKENFFELEIVCLHIPKWMDRYLNEQKYSIKSENRKDGFCHAFVYSKQKNTSLN